MLFRSNRSLGVGALGGMIVGTLALIYVVPVFFIAFQTLQERFVAPNNYDIND